MGGWVGEISQQKVGIAGAVCWIRGRVGTLLIHSLIWDMFEIPHYKA